MTGLWGGTAMVRKADGKMHVLQIGERVEKGDVILTTQDGIVQLTPEETPAPVAAAAPDTDLDRVIAEIDNPTEETAPAAGLAGGDGGDMQPGLRVDRISEGTTPASFSQSFEATPATFPPVTPTTAGSTAAADPAPAPSPTPAPPPAPVDASISLTASAPTVTEGGSLVYTAVVNQPVTGSALVINLSNGTTITIPVGQTSGTSAAVPVRADDAYAQNPDTVSVSVTGTSGGSFGTVTPGQPAVSTVVDDADVTTVSVSASSATAAEGGSVTYTVAVNNPVTGSPLVVTLSNGQTITIPVGASSGTGAPFPVRGDDAYVQGDRPLNVSVTGTTGANYEAVAIGGSATTTVTDQATTTTVTLTASAASVAEGGSVVYTATLSNPVTGSPVVLTLSNGQTITIAVGDSSGSSAPFAVRGDDPYVQGTQTVTVGVGSATGGNFEQLDTTFSSASTQVADNGTATTLTVTASASTITEGGSLTYTVTLNNAVTGAPLVVTLSNGQTITIPVGASSATGPAIAVRADDAHAQGSVDTVVSVTGTSGGNFESVTSTAAATTTVVDDNDVTTLTLTPSAATVTEGGSIVYTVTLSNAVQGSPLTLTLSNGQTVTIPVGQTTGTTAPYAVRADDAYQQGDEPLDVTVTGKSGGNFESLDTSGTASTVVRDDADATVVTVTPSATTVAEGGSISYTVSVNHEVKGSDFTVTLSNGQTITIPVGQSSATGPAIAVRPDDAQAQGNVDTVVKIDDTSGGNFEAVDKTSTATTTVTDGGADTTLTITPSAANVTEGGSITYTVTLSNAVAGTPLTLTLSNGQTVTIPVGQTTGTTAPYAVRADDFYQQGDETLDVTVSGKSGGNFESLDTTGTATTTVSDDADQTVVTVTASAGTIAEGGSLTYTVSVNHEVKGSDFVVTLSNGQTITIPVGQSSATGPAIPVRPDDAQAQGSLDTVVKIDDTSGGNFEAIDKTSTATTTVTDGGAPTTLTITPSAANVTEGGSITYTVTLSNAVAGTPLTLTLSNGQTVTIPVGQTTGTTDPYAVRADDFYKQGDQQLDVTVTGKTGGNFESLDTTGTATSVVHDDADQTIVTVKASDSMIAEGGSLTYTVSVNHPVTGTPFVVTLSNGQTITIPVGQSSATGPAIDVRPADAQSQGNETTVVKIDDTSGGNFEAVDKTSTATTVVTDSGVITSLTITPSATSVTEGGSIVYTVTLSNAVAGSPLTLTLSNGQTVTIPVGQTTGMTDPYAVRADDVYQQGDEALDVTVTGHTGGNFEALDTDGTASSTVRDDADETIVTVTPSAGTIAEGGSLTYTVSVNHEVKGSDFVVTLSNGQTITIPVGQSSATGPAIAVRPDDAQAQGSVDTVVKIDGTSGGNFEAIDKTSTATTTVTDGGAPTTLTITASAANVTEGGSIVYTVTLSNAVAGTPLTLTLSNGQTVTIPVGQTTGTTDPYAVRADDVYKQGDEQLDVTVSGKSGGNFESLDTTGTATTTVSDDADQTIVTVTPSAGTIAEGGSLTYTVSVNHEVKGSDFTVTLSNGQVITIPVGQSSATGTAIAVRPDDAQAQGNVDTVVKIDDTSGGNFEAVDKTSTATTTVTDGGADTTLTITPSAANVTEGGSIVYTVTLSNAVAGTPLTLTLSNGQTVTIPVGQTTGTTDPYAVRADDFYKQGDEQLDVTVSGKSGGNFESLDTTGTATTVVHDDADQTVVTVTPSVSTVAEGGTISYTVSVNHEVKGTDFVVTLSNGQVITIPVGESSVTGPAIAVRPDDAQVQGSVNTVVKIDDTSGGNFEAIDKTSTATTTVTDGGAPTTLTITPSAANVTEGGSIVYTVTLSNAVAGTPLTLTLSNGQTVTIPVGQTTGTTDPYAVRADDFYKQGDETLDVTVSGKSGGNFESLDTTGTATTTVSDDADQTIVTVTPSAGTIAEGGSLTYTVSVNHEVKGSDFTVTLSNGQVITIPVGQSSATGPAIAVRPDDAQAQGNVDTVVKIDDTSGGNFEAVDKTSTATTTVTDGGADTTLTITPSAANVTEGGSIVYTVTLSNAVAGTPLTLTLSNGQTVTIPVGQTTGTTDPYAVRADDVYKQGDETLDVTVSGKSGGNFESLDTTGTATTVVHDDADQTVVTVTPSAGTIAEGGSLTYTVSVNHEVKGSDFTVTLSNGQVITIPVGQSSATGPAIAVRPDDAQAQGNVDTVVKIDDTSGGNFEAIDKTSTATTTVTDGGAPTTLTITPSAANVTEGGSIVYTVTLSNAVAGTPLTLTLSNGQTVTIPVGQTTGTTAAYAVRADDFYKQGDETLDVTVSGKSGGNFESLDTTGTATTVVHDDADQTVVTVTPSVSTVAEGGTIAYTVSVNHEVKDTPFSVTLSNGQTITIPVGQSSATGPAIAVRPDDAQAQGNVDTIVKIDDTSGGNFEAIDKTSTATTTVTDGGAPTTLTITPSAANVTEGGSIVYTVTLSNAVAGTPLTLTLSNGQTVTIPVGQTTGTTDPYAVRADDFYKQGDETLDVTVSGKSGGNFESLDTTGTATTTVSDDADQTIVTVTPSAGTIAEGGSLTYTVSVNHEVKGSDFTVTLSNGQTITIPVGQSSATGPAIAVRPDDAQAQGSLDTVVKIDDTSGGNFEAIDKTSTATTTVTDGGAPTTLTITASAANVTEGGSIVYTVTLSNAVAGTPLTLTLSNGQTVTIPVGQTTGTTDPYAVRADDFYKQGDQQLDVTVTGKTGGNFESLDTTGTATTTVHDDADQTIVTVTPSVTTVAEGGTISYTVSVNHEVKGSDFTVTLSNGQVITIPVGQSSVTGPAIAVRPDDAQVQGSVDTVVKIDGTSGGNFEAVDTTSTATTTVTDGGIATTLTITPSAANVTEGGSIIYTVTLSNAVAGTPLTLTLSNGQTVTIPVGQTTGTTDPYAVRADDVYKQGDQQLDVTVTGKTGGNFESLDTTGTATSVVHDDADQTVVTVSPSVTTVAEGGTITYTVSVNHEVKGTDFTVTLSNGQTITIPVGQSSATGPAIAVRPDDAQAQGNVDTVVKIDGTSGGNFEAVDATSTATTTVSDGGAATTLTITPSAANVTEGGSITYTVTLSNAVAGTPLTLTLSNGQTVTIPVGQTTGHTDPYAVRADDFYKQGDQQLDVTVTGKSGGNFESLDTTGTATSVVHDDADQTIVTVKASDTVIAEGGSLTYTVSVNHPVTGTPFVVTLSNGQTISIPVGQSSATGPAIDVRPADAQSQGNEDTVVKIDGTSGGNFEAVDTTSTTSTTVTDSGAITTLTLTASAANVTEGGSIVYTVTLSNTVQGTPLTLTLSNGQTVTIPVGENHASTGAYAVRADDFYKQGDQQLDVTITGKSGGTFESLNTAGTATTVVHDDADQTVVTVTPSAGTIAEGGSLTYTVSVNHPVTGTPFAVTLSNGQTISIPVGQSSATGPAIPVRPDDAQAQGNVDTVVKIDGTSGGNFEAVDTTSTATTTVTDGGVATTLTITPSAANVTEGGSIIYTVTLSSAVAGTPLTLTLSNGQTVTIPVGQTTGTTDPYAVRADDFYKQGDQQLDVTVTGKTGGNFESLDTTGTATSVVHDDADQTVVTVTPSAGTIAEGGSLTYTVSVNHPVTGTPFVVTLSNGQTISIPVGQSSATGPAIPVRPDDAQAQGNVDTVVKIDDTSGGNFEAVDKTSTATTTVTDGGADTTLTITPSAANVTEGGSIVYTVTLSHAVAGTPLTLTLSNGQTVTIPVGQTTGTTAAYTVRADDFYKQGDQQLDVTVTGKSGGNFESLNTTGTATTVVHDDADATVVTVTPSVTTVAEGGSITYTVSVNHAVTDTPFLVTLSNGQTITIPVGQSSATGPAIAVRPDDAQAQGNVDTIVKIDDTSGGNFEAIDKTSTATTTVTDGGAPTTLTITPSAANVTEGGSIVYTVTLSNAVAGSPLTLTLSNGQTVTIPVGQTTGTSDPYAVRADDFYKQGDQQLDVTITGKSGGNFESLDTTGTASSVVHDDADATIVTVTPSATSIAEGGALTYTVSVNHAVTGSPFAVTLSNGQTITIPVGQSSFTGPAIAVRADDAYAQGNVDTVVSITGTSGGNFEAVTTTSTATTTVTDDSDITRISLTGDASVTEGGTAHYTLSLTNPPTSTVTVTLTYSGTAANGVDFTGQTTVTIPANSSSVNFDIATIDDTLIEGAENFTVTIGGATGGGFEQLAVNPASSAVTTTIVDNDFPSLSVSSPTVAESIPFMVFEVKLSAPAPTDTTVNLTLANGTAVGGGVDYGSTTANNLQISTDGGLTWKNGTTYTFPANGATSVLVRTAVINDSIDEANEQFSLTATVTAGTTSNPDATGTATILDNDPTMSIAPISVNEDAGFAVFEVKLSHGSPSTTTVGLALGNGTATGGGVDFGSTTGTNLQVSTDGGQTWTNATSATFAANSTSVLVRTPIVNDTAYEGNETFTLTATRTGGSTANASVQAVATIVDNDTATPVLDLDGNNSSGATGANYAVTFTEGQGGSGVSIADTDMTITDADSTTMAGATITLTNRMDGDALNLGNDVGGVRVTNTVNNSGSIVIQISGSGTLAQYIERIRNITFTNSSDNPSDTPRVITVTVTDGVNTSNLATTTVNVVPVNDLPEGRDVTLTTNEDTRLTLSLANFQMNDKEDGNNVNPTTVRIDTLPTNGTLYLNGVAVTQGAIVTAAQIAGNQLTFVPNPDDNGANYSKFTFSVGDSNGGYDTVPNTVTFNVNAVSDGTPVAVADQFRTTLGTPIILTKAQLLANDTLLDHARITSVSAGTGGTLVTNADGTYTFTPSAAGNGTFTYTLTDDDGQTSTATVTIATSQARDDFATVHESALTGGTGGGTTVATGSLIANDTGATSVSYVKFGGTTYNIASGGSVTIDSPLGKLVVQSDGTYTYTLETNANNNTAATNLSVAEDFTYKPNNGNEAVLHVDIVDDKPQVADHTVSVSQVPLPTYNLVLVLDISGSMTTTAYGGLVRSVDANGNQTGTTTRLAMAKAALIELVEQYYSQAQTVSVKLVTFSSSASIVNPNNVAYTTLAQVKAAINGITGTTSGGTDYEAALAKAQEAYGTVNTNVKNTTYFLSDGAPGEGNTAAQTAIYNAFTAQNGVQSYAVGIGTGISSTTALDNIHNVDADGSGTKDGAVLVTDLNQLSSSLLATVPPAYGGNVVSTSGSAIGSAFGADGGQVVTMTMTLAGKVVTFTYDAANNRISQSGTTTTISGDMLTLNSTNGFTKGTLLFNFTTGNYTYYTNGTAANGESFTLTFTAKDGDGDVTAPTNLNFVIANGAPIARPDTDTLDINQSHLEGNVITGAGTDGGLALGSGVASFSARGDGVDNAVDNAQVSSISFKGQTFNLLVNSTGSGTGYTYVIANGQLTWTGSGTANAGSKLVFSKTGYYDYTPPTAALTDTPHKAAVTNSYTSAINNNANGVAITAFQQNGSVGTVVLNSGSGTSGLGVSANNSASSLAALERLVFTFSQSSHPQGVQGVKFNIATGSNLDNATAIVSALTYTMYDVAGVLLGQFVSSAEGTVTLPTEYGNIGRIEVEANSPATAYISGLTFESINVDNAATAVEPTVIGYTLTDTDNQSSSSTLTLNVISNNLFGTDASETITGTAANDHIQGGAGNDTLHGGAGHDILEGGLGNDILNGNDGNDILRGGEGNDTLDGGNGKDILVGGKGNDFLTGGADSDVFRWEFADQGVKGAPAVDTVTDFNNAAASAGGDVLDLRDLLQGETSLGAATGNLTNYLHFETSGNTTTIQISTTGGFSGGYNAGAVDQAIKLSGVDLTVGGALNTDQQIIQDLLNKSKLIVDGN
ncbi:hypothetical protein A4W93_10445 [Piscinibacter gummiphilus]|uniref:VWFA domain-containing protein n=1 Tax=Piscinibacter gummiphilus TaxID=946333 RepID=A0A1W6L7V4_9BURK|nr:hypothetical protein A4W93_10445 [Piscinibacter gummiphilus]ATU64958.1 hypothetical protein CPZ87_10520 [Piscinibacter gummiphilus]